MSKNFSKAGMIFRRIIYRLGKYSMFVVTVITCYNLTTHLLELRAERLKREKAKRAIFVVLSIIAWLSAIALACAALLKYIKHLRKGYLLDLFDSEAYDVIEPDEEIPAESFIKYELGGNEDTAEHESLSFNHIPLDEDASEDDYK